MKFEIFKYNLRPQDVNIENIIYKNIPELKYIYKEPELFTLIEKNENNILTIILEVNTNILKNYIINGRYFNGRKLLFNLIKEKYDDNLYNTELNKTDDIVNYIKNIKTKYYSYNYDYVLDNNIYVNTYLDKWILTPKKEEINIDTIVLFSKKPFDTSFLKEFEIHNDIINNNDIMKYLYDNNFDLNINLVICHQKDILMFNNTEYNVICDYSKLTYKDMICSKTIVITFSVLLKIQYNKYICNYLIDSESIFDSINILSEELMRNKNLLNETMPFIYLFKWNNIFIYNTETIKIKNTYDLIKNLKSNKKILLYNTSNIYPYIEKDILWLSNCNNVHKETYINNCIAYTENNIEFKSDMINIEYYDIEKYINNYRKYKFPLISSCISYSSLNDIKKSIMFNIEYFKSLLIKNNVKNNMILNAYESINNIDNDIINEIEYIKQDINSNNNKIQQLTDSNNYCIQILNEGVELDKCNICLDKPDITCILRCGHMYCLGCMLTLSKHKLFIKCPKCREKINKTEIYVVNRNNESNYGSIFNYIINNIENKIIISSDRFIQLLSVYTGISKYVKRKYINKTTLVSYNNAIRLFNNSVISLKDILLVHNDTKSNYNKLLIKLKNTNFNIKILKNK